MMDVIQVGFRGHRLDELRGPRTPVLVLGSNRGLPGVL
jgi:hypothetical protein